MNNIRLEVWPAPGVGIISGVSKVPFKLDGNWSILRKVDVFNYQNISPRIKVKVDSVNNQYWKSLGIAIDLNESLLEGYPFHLLEILKFKFCMNFVCYGNHHATQLR